MIVSFYSSHLLQYLSLCRSRTVCTSVCVMYACVCLYICLCVCMSVFVCISVCVFVHLSACLYVCLCVLPRVTCDLLQIRAKYRWITALMRRESNRAPLWHRRPRSHRRPVLDHHWVARWHRYRVPLYCPPLNSHSPFLPAATLCPSRTS